MKLRALIVDDEIRSANTLAIILKNYLADSIEVIGEAYSADEALQIIEDKKPDLVFLDIEMPHKNGFDLLASLSETNFQVIFTTAFEQYALKAIKVSAIDYLLKPINIVELKQAVGKAIKLKENQKSSGIPALLQNYENLQSKNEPTITLPVMDGMEIINIKDIVMIKADLDYSKVYTSNSKVHYVLKSIKFFDEVLSSNLFFRTHYSFLINKKHILKFIKDSLTIETEINQEVPVSRRRKPEFIEWLSK